MNQAPLTLAIRAICADFALRLYVQVVVITSVILFILVVACSYLVTVISAWWWLLFAPLILFIVIFIVAAIISRVVIGILKPNQSREQKKLVRQFVDTLQGTSEMVQTPKFILFFRLVKDIIRPNKQNLVSEFTLKAGSLKTILQEIVASFR